MVNVSLNCFYSCSLLQEKTVSISNCRLNNLTHGVAEETLRIDKTNTNDVQDENIVLETIT